MLNINIGSEIGKLNGVILHTPGIEIERMTPQTIQECLYSDLLNLQYAQNEYNYFSGVLGKATTTFQVKDLLSEVLKKQEAREFLLSQMAELRDNPALKEELASLSSELLAKVMIEGDEKTIRPLYNLYFTRDASSSLYNKVLINSMSFPVRERETLVMESIFKYYFGAETICANTYSDQARTEGGDVMPAREDVLFLGQGIRSNKQGLEFLIKHFQETKGKHNILIQELPHTPESFIHLDMCFTILDKDRCMAYKPLIVDNKDNFEVCHIEIDGQTVRYHQKQSFLQGTKDLGFEFEPVFCGNNNPLYQEREQWHSGANFFSMGEGKIIGYARNQYTIEALNNSGFEVLKAEDICSDKVIMNDHKRFVVVCNAAELPRGGGGARCMTMPINRENVNW